MALSHNAPQLRIKPTLPGSGHVDGAWWPTSGNLAAALPDLLDQVGTRIGTVARVNFRLDEWSAGTPRKLDRGTRPVRLDGYHNQPADTIYQRDLAVSFLHLGRRQADRDNHERRYDRGRPPTSLNARLAPGRVCDNRGKE